MAGTQVAWGIDIGTTALKAMKLRREGDKLELLALDVIDHERFLTEVDVDRKEVVGQTLRKFLDRNPILHREKVFVSSPGSTSFSRFVKLPPVDPKRIPDIVQFEAIQQIPFPLDQVNWDYQTFQSADSPDVEIGIFAIKKDLVTQLLNDFQLAGVTVHGVQISPLAVYNAMVYEGRLKDKGTIVLDIGADHTDLIIMDQGRLWLRTINLGGNSFTEALAKSFLQSFRRAEELKKKRAHQQIPAADIPGYASHLCRHGAGNSAVYRLLQQRASRIQAGADCWHGQSAAVEQSAKVPIAISGNGS